MTDLEAAVQTQDPTVSAIDEGILDTGTKSNLPFDMVDTGNASNLASDPIQLC